MLRRVQHGLEQMFKHEPAAESRLDDEAAGGGLASSASAVGETEPVVRNGSNREATARSVPTTASRSARPKDPLSMVASDLMTSPAIAVSTADPVSSVARRMLETDVNGMPVVDAAGFPVGMVSDGDLVGRRGDRRDWWLEMLATGSPPDAGLPLPELDKAVHEVMTSPVITVAHTASIKDIAEALQAHRVKRLPVLEKGRLVGIVSRADLLRAAETMPRPNLPKESGGSGFLDFLESMIGGASLRGGLERPGTKGEAEPGKEVKPEPAVLSAASLREQVNAYKAQIVDQKQALARDAQLERERQVKELLDQRVGEDFWLERLERAKLAASNGELELMLLRFPADLCSDGGRKIDVAEEGWEGTLRGAAAEVYSRWRTELKPLGFGLSARIVSFAEDGIIGDLGLFLSWGK